MSDRKFITLKEALAMLPDGEYVHCFTTPAVNTLIGADWSKKQVLEYLAAGRPELAGPTATRMGHSLCCGLYFFQTKEKP